DVDLVAGEALAQSGEELDVVRIEEQVAVGLQHRADRAGAAGREPPGADMRAVVETARRLGHALPRRLADLREAVEGAADRRLRQAETLCQLLEPHCGSVPPMPFKAL